MHCGHLAHVICASNENQSPIRRAYSSEAVMRTEVGGEPWRSLLAHADHAKEPRATVRGFDVGALSGYQREEWGSVRPAIALTAGSRLS